MLPAGDLSTDCWWVNLFAFGDGWHCTHHAFPFSARHGLEVRPRHNLHTAGLYISLRALPATTVHTPGTTQTPSVHCRSIFCCCICYSGLQWYQFDPVWYIVWTLEKLGLAWDVKLPTERDLARRRIAPKPAAPASSKQAGKAGRAKNA